MFILCPVVGDAAQVKKDGWINLFFCFSISISSRKFFHHVQLCLQQMPRWISSCGCCFWCAFRLGNGIAAMETLLTIADVYGDGIVHWLVSRHLISRKRTRATLAPWPLRCADEVWVSECQRADVTWCNPGLFWSAKMMFAILLGFAVVPLYMAWPIVDGGPYNGVVCCSSESQKRRNTCVTITVANRI